LTGFGWSPSRRDALRPAVCGHEAITPARVVGRVVVTIYGRPFAVMGFTVVEGRIVAIDAIADPERVRRIAAPVLHDG
jgi:RNA polymerase sigma-70 factor (ECF subfamily)